MSAVGLHPGDLFADRFRIERLLGVGGFARVYLATHLALERPVALKVMNPVGSASVALPPEKVERFFKRFEREAKIVSKLKAAETVEVYEYGRTDDGLAFMALEFIDGPNLLTVMTREGRLDSERVARILGGILRSLSEAHELGVLHRDVKPANVMVFERYGEPDCVKMLDFGVVKITRDIGVSFSSLTSEGNVVGTPRYMAPEYIRDNVVNEQTDLYAVGLVAWEMLVGRPAIEGETAVQVMSAQIKPEPIRLPDDVDVSPRLKAVVEGMLEKDPERRFESASEVLELLETGRLAGFTQDDLALAATTESSAVRRVADAVEPATESWEAPGNRGPADRRPSHGSRGDEDSRFLLDEDSRSSHGDRPSVSELGNAPIEIDWPEEAQQPTQDDRDGSAALRIVAAIVFGLIVGIAAWYLLRT